MQFSNTKCKDIFVALKNESLGSSKSWTFVTTLQKTPNKISHLLLWLKGYGYCERWEVEVIEAGEVRLWMRLGRGSHLDLEGSSGWMSLLSSGSLLWPNTLRIKSLLFCTEWSLQREERLTIQINKQEGAACTLLLQEKSLKGKCCIDCRAGALKLCSRGCEQWVSELVTDRVLRDCCNVCNANMRQLELMPVINICCHTHSLHNTAATGYWSSHHNCWETQTRPRSLSLIDRLNL